MQITLCLYPQFSNFCLANALEPLRAANDLANKKLYHWRIVTPDGGALRSSSGMSLSPDGALSTARGDALFVMPSYGYATFDEAKHHARLRRAATRHEIVAGLDMGAWIMAAAGLLERRRATIHWDEYAAFAEQFPNVEATPERFVQDGPRWTCGVATTAFDLVLAMIEQQHGASLRLDVAGLFMHGEWRGALQGPATGEARVDAAMALMRRHIQTPKSIPEIALAIGLSPRRMEALFLDRLGAPPRDVYLRLRLSEAQRLLRQTAISVGEIARRCGYEDPSALGRAFRRAYQTSPSTWRQAQRATSTAAASGSENS